MNTAGGSTGRNVFLLLLAVLYPFHTYIDAPGGIINVSLGDPLIAFGLLGLAISLVGDFSLPYTMPPVVMLILAALVSLVPPLVLEGSGAPYFSLEPGLVELVKVIGSLAWMVVLYWMLRRDPLGGIRVFAAVSVAMAAGFAIWTISESLRLPGTRPPGPFENENLYANYLTLNLFLTLVLSRLDGSRGGRTLRMPNWLTVPVLAAGILATGSRGAILGALVSYPFAMRAPARMTARQIAVVVITLGLSVVALVAFWRANPFVAGRVSGLLAGEGPNIASRRSLWAAALEAFTTAPLFGIGYHQFPQYLEAAYGLKPTVVHNTYLSVAAELGIVGIIAFAWLVLTVIRDGLRASRRTGFEAGRLLVLFVVATLVQGVVANIEHYRSLWIAIGALAAIRGLTMVRVSSPLPRLPWVVRGRVEVNGNA